MSPARRQRVVIYRLGSLGDTVVALPCLHKVEQCFPDAERIVLTNFPVHAKAPPLQAILGNSGLAHAYMAYPASTRSWRDLLRLLRELRALQADTLVYLTPARGRIAAWRDLLFFKLCGIRHIVGVPLSAALQYHRRGADGQFEMECQRLARCMAALGPVDLDDRSGWDLRLTPDERDEARRLLAPAGGRALIAINMGGKVAINDWGADNWSALIDRLGPMYRQHALVIVGGPEDSARADAVGARWPGPALNLCGGPAPRVSAAVLSASDLFIGHDSGPMHLASSVGIPCVGLFGQNHPPRKWHPYGSRHRVLHDMRGVGSIAVSDVVDAVARLLPADSAEGAPVSATDAGRSP